MSTTEIDLIHNHAVEHATTGTVASAVRLSPHPGVDIAAQPQLGGMARLTPTLRAVVAGAAALHAVAPRLTTEVMLRHFTQPRRKARRDYRDRLPEGYCHLQVPHGKQALTGWQWGRSGPATLLVHGWEDHTGSMVHLVPGLLAQGRRVYVLDLPGHGLSPRARTHLVDASDALTAMLRACGPVESIVAHSFGAAATCLMLEQMPSLSPERLALVSPMQSIDQHLEIFTSIAGLSPARAEHLRRRVTHLLGCPPDAVCALKAARSLNLQALVVHDRHDPVIPHGVGHSMAQSLRGARFLSTSNLGHRGVLRCPEVRAQILDHLNPFACSAGGSHGTRP